MPAGPRLVAILVGVIFVVGVGALVLRGDGEEGELGRSPSATVRPSVGASPSAAASPEASEDASRSPAAAETLAALAEIEEQVIAIRGLEAADIGPPEIITRAELADELEAIFAEEYPPEEQERDNQVLRAFGLLEAGQDIAALQLELLSDQVLGFYDDTDKRMVVVSDAGLDVEARVTYAHEYTHALQDAAFGLDTLETDEPGQDDRGLARTALIEGDASLAMLAWMFQHLDPDEIAEYLGSAELPDTSGIPSWMVAQLAFPYEAGLIWASALAGSDPFAPDFSEIDAAYTDPPDSTEQVIDLEAWETREAPDPVEVADLAPALGSGWDEVDTTPVGQASIEIFLEHLGAGAADASAAAEGWGGDEATVAAGPDEAFALAWRLRFETNADADEFVAAYDTVIEGLPFPASVTTLPDGDVLVLHASSDELLVQAAAAAS